MWVLYALPSMSIPITHSGRDQKVTQNASLPGHIKLTVSWTLARTPFITWSPHIIILTEGP